MAQIAYPTTAHNSRALTPREYEDLMYPAMPDGLAGLPSDPPLIYADGSALAVKVRANRGGWLRGLRLETGDTEQSIAVASNNTAGMIRKDLIVWRMTRNPWDASIVRIQGIPLANPTVPSPVYGADTSTGMWDLPLAVVTVNAGDAFVTAAKVTPAAWYVGEDGQILCTDTTRPPHHPGRSAYETNTKRWILSDGTKWTVAVENSGVLGVSLLSGYSTLENRLQRVNGQCVLNLKVRRTNGTIPANATVKVGTLPTGFWPTFNVEVAARYSSSAGLAAGLQVTTDGGVYVITPPAVDIDQNRTVNGSLTWFTA